MQKNRMGLSLLSLVMLLPLIGCGGKGVGEVSGKVSFNGEPLPGGMVTFIAENGVAKACRIGEDGSYTLAGIPEGLARITVTTQAPVQIQGAQSFEPLGKYVRIPPRYQDPASSGFTLAVKRGPQKHDLTLAP